MAAVLEGYNRVSGMLEQDEAMQEFVGLVEWYPGWWPRDKQAI